MKVLRWPLGILWLLGAVVWLSACGSADPTPTPTPAIDTVTPTPAMMGFDAEWEALIAAAQAEGTLVVGGPTNEQVVREFGERFGIDVRISPGSGFEITDRLLAEQSVRRYTMDTMWNGRDPVLTRMIPNDALEPLRDWLIHPEVLDTSLWLNDQWWWSDPTQEYALLFKGCSSAETLNLWYNYDEISEEEINTIQHATDLLDPKWRGKIAARSPFSPGATGTWFRMMVTPDLGPEFVRPILEDHDVFFHRDVAVLADSIGQGAYPLGIMISQVIDDLAAAGVHVRELNRQLSNTVGLGSVGRDQVLVVKNPPHPNAVKLWVNWFLSKEGQTVYQELPSPSEIARNQWDDPNWIGHVRWSLRNDLDPPTKGRLSCARKPGEEYFWPEADPEVQGLMQPSLEQVREWGEQAGIN